MGIDFFKRTSYQISKLITRKYSTSFSLSVSLLDNAERDAIYGIYGFVRLADEIVDTFDASFDRKYLLDKLREDAQYAILHGISANPIILSFADTVSKYKIDWSYIDAFLRSMYYDLVKTDYSTREELTDYIYGSAEVVGLMCLKVFCKGDETLYDQLFKYARSLGSAFQKVNFLRDISSDTNELGRIYFPELTQSHLSEEVKSILIRSIERNFDNILQYLRSLMQVNPKHIDVLFRSFWQQSDVISMPRRAVRLFRSSRFFSGAPRSTPMPFTRCYLISNSNTRDIITLKVACTRLFRVCCRSSKK